MISANVQIASSFSHPYRKGGKGGREHFHSGGEEPGHLVLLEALQFVMEQQTEVAAALLPSACFQLSSTLNFNYGAACLLAAISLLSWKKYRQLTKVRGCIFCRVKQSYLIQPAGQKTPSICIFGQQYGSQGTPATFLTGKSSSITVTYFFQVQGLHCGRTSPAHPSINQKQTFTQGML